jgi:bud emergence protein 1
MKALRKSLNRDHHQSQSAISPPTLTLSKPASAAVPPKQVIRAVVNHRAQSATELSFEKGDFFYVIKEVNNGGSWFEVHNPATGSRGLVPRSLFEDVMKNNNS